LAGQWTQIDTAMAAANPVTFKAQLKAVAENELDSLFVHIESLQFNANPLGRLCGTVDKTLKIANDRMNGLIATFEDALTADTQAVKQAGKQDIQLVRQQIVEFSSGIHSTLDQLRFAIQSAVESWMPGIGFVVNTWVEPIFGILADIDRTSNDAELSIAAAQSLLSKIKKLNSPLDAAKKQLESIAADNEDLKKLQLATIADLDSLVRKQLEGDVHTVVRKSIDQIIDAAPTFPTDPAGLRAALMDLAQQAQSSVTGSLKTQLDILQGNIQSSETAVLNIFGKLVQGAGQEVLDALGKLTTGPAKDQLEALRQRAEDTFGRYVDTLLTNLPGQIDLKSVPRGDAVAPILQRAFGEAPRVPNLNFSLPNVGYFYVPDLKNVNLTPLLTQVSDLGAALSPLGSMLPSTAILDRMLPSDLLKNFNLSDVLPNFAGLKLDSLFSGLKMPEGAAKYIKITHGLDQSSKRAWVQGDIDFTTDTLATLFTIGPLALQLPKATFKCQVKLQADASGQIVKQATGSITGDWTLIISGTRLITMVSTSLSFDEQGHVHFNVSPDRVVLSEALNFIDQIIASYSAPGSGFTILPSLNGIQTRLDLPIPNTSAGTTGITNLTFGFGFGLQFDPFAITAGFNLGRKKAPFNIAVFILGGAGYIETDITFIPGEQLTCNVSIELAASASLAIAFGPISGYVAIFLGMSVNFHTGNGTDLRLGIFIQVVGEVSILSIVSAYVGLRLEATYDNGIFTGRGQFTISIKICWCFTLEVDEHVEFTLGHGGGGGPQQLALNEPPTLFVMNEAIPDTPSSIFTVKTPPNYMDIATRYINMLS
jgi:hypothetical protein